jgi:hypothetical protein
MPIFLAEALKASALAVATRVSILMHTISNLVSLTSQKRQTMEVRGNTLIGYVDFYEC